PVGGTVHGGGDSGVIPRGCGHDLADRAGVRRDRVEQFGRQGGPVAAHETPQTWMVNGPSGASPSQLPRAALPPWSLHSGWQHDAPASPCQNSRSTYRPVASRYGMVRAKAAPDRMSSSITGRWWIRVGVGVGRVVLLAKVLGEQVERPAGDEPAGVLG